MQMITPIKQIKSNNTHKEDQWSTATNVNKPHTREENEKRERIRCCVLLLKKIHTSRIQSIKNRNGRMSESSLSYIKGGEIVFLCLCDLGGDEREERIRRKANVTTQTETHPTPGSYHWTSPPLVNNIHLSFPFISHIFTATKTRSQPSLPLSLPYLILNSSPLRTTKSQPSHNICTN